MDFEKEYQKLLEKKIKAGGFNPGYFEGEGFKTYNLGGYKQEFADTKKYNPETKKFELFDTRTDKFFDKESANEFITDQNKQANEAYFLEVFGTKTPEADLEYLKAARDLQRLKQREGLLIYNVRDYFSKKVTGSEDSVYDKQFDNKIAKKEQELLELKENTSFITRDNAQLELGIQNAIKNQEEQPVNIKDLSVITPYVETKRKQLEIDKQFNTSPSGVTY
tara:strand:- start:75 stop:740 length:666 start_codon:yes stop_codon:yes gene_type:complete